MATDLQSVLGYRPVRNSDDPYPDNEVEVDVDSVVTGNITVDLRNEFLFSTVSVGGGVIAIKRYDLNNLQDAPETVTTFVPATGAGFASACCDWRNQRLYYAVGTTLNATTHVMEIHRINYDGSDGTLLHTESTSLDELGQRPVMTLSHFMWEPVNECLYYARRHPYGRTIPGTPPTSDTNIYAYLKRINSEDGSGAATLIAIENTTDLAGNSSIEGIGMSVARESLVWIERRQTGDSGSNTTRDYLVTGDLSAGSQAVLLDVLQPDYNLRFCKVSQFEDRIYFDSGVPDFYMKKVPFTATGPGDIETVLDATQGLTDGPTLVFFSAQFGCGTEEDDEYSGPCWSSL